MMMMSFGIGAMLAIGVAPAVIHLPTLVVFSAVMGGPLMLELL